jgi:hypothetical protein
MPTDFRSAPSYIPDRNHNSQKKFRRENTASLCYTSSVNGEPFLGMLMLSPSEYTTRWRTHHIQSPTLLIDSITTILTLERHHQGYVLLLQLARQMVACCNLT